MSYLVTGRTYPHRDALRAMGGRWDRMDKGWRFSTQAAADAATALVEGTATPARPITNGTDATVPPTNATSQPTPTPTPADPSRAILADVLAYLPPRVLADAMIAAGVARQDAERVAVRAGECVNMLVRA